MSLVENIKGLCDKNNISINKLEKELGLGRGNIARWDNNAPSYDKLMSVAEYFNVTVEQLVKSPIDGILAAFKAIPGFIDPMDLVTPVAAIPVDDELAPYVEMLLERPELRTLLEVGNENSPEDVEMMANLMSKLRKGDNSGTD